MVLEHGADVGMAFDGDADRVFLVDERAEDVSGSLLTALVADGDAGARARREDRLQPHLLVDGPRSHPGTRRRADPSPRGPFVHQAGDGRDGAVFGGEHSGHYYFRDNYSADSGLIAAVITLGELSSPTRPLSQLLQPFRRYFSSGEINSHVDDPLAKIEEIAAALRDGRQDRLDGLTVEFDDWWCNVRPSNTEPLLRLNVEADDAGAPRRQDRGASLVLIRGARKRGTSRDARCGTAGDPRVSERSRGGGLSARTSR